MSQTIFVYGTLRTGECNHHLIAPFVQSAAPAHIEQMALYPVTTTYPGMVPGSGQVAGEWVAIDPERWDEALGVLDELEDYYGPGHADNHYDRVILTVQAPHGPERAWVYLWLLGVNGLESIPGGDWVAYRAGRR